MSKPKKAPCIDVRTDVHKDERFKVVGEICGYNHYEAIGRMHGLWSWCRDRGLQDTRDGIDGYVVSAAIVRRLLGPNGPAAILGGEYGDDLALAVELADGMLYLRGTSEYVAAARAHAVTSSAGGQARRDGGDRDDAGRYVGKTTIVQPELHPDSTREPAEHPPASQPTPASSSSLFPLPSSQSGSQNPPAPRAIQPSTGYDPENPADRLRLAEKTYERIAIARDVIAAELGLRDVVPMPRKNTPAEPIGFRDLRERIRAEGAVAPQACEAVAANLERQAREEQSVEWLSDKAFTEGGWRTARNGGSTRKRAGPRARGDGALIGAANPRSDHPVSDAPVSFKDL